MSEGLIVRTASNIVQIDSEYSNYCVYSQGSFSSLTGLTIAAPGIPGCKIFVELVTDVEIYCQFNNGNWEIICNSYAGTKTISYFISIPSEFSTTPTNKGYGLNVYKSDGSLAFSSNLPYMDIISFGVLNNTHTTQNLTLPSTTIGKKQYIDASQLYFFGEWSVSFEGGGTEQGTFRLSVLRTSAFGYQIYSSFSDDLNYINTGQPSSWYRINDSRYFLIVER